MAEDRICEMVRWKWSYLECKKKKKRYKPVVKLTHPYIQHDRSSATPASRLDLGLADKFVSDTASTPVQGDHVQTLCPLDSSHYGLTLMVLWGALGVDCLDPCNTIRRCACVRVGICIFVVCFIYKRTLSNIYCLWSCSYTLRVLKYRNTCVM